MTARELISTLAGKTIHKIDLVPLESSHEYPAILQIDLSGGQSMLIRLTPKGRAMLERAVSGEDYEYPDRWLGSKLDSFRPAGRWFVPEGFIVPQSSSEYASCRALAARGLLKSGSVKPCAELPYGQGGYVLTKKGRSALGR